ncbi:IPTL-CTERM sorting domain-containing protein [Thiothrix lacustris]|uniref:IPTL-CTERM sorting domain-containing protein n=1 Tax=Thiothrix lacustris TaxID=525917 RepID=UPI0027E4E7D1|nr:IPTL-CTERM sorting domain-containing protein [Thiothrix lacustris]WMP16628.1 IPTL-CTERM sorting domain-containing protein [Thiothrix lacustris]
MKKMTSAKALLLTFCSVSVLTAANQSWAAITTVTNCAQVSAVAEADSNSTPNNKSEADLLDAFAADTLEKDEACVSLKALPAPVSVGDYIWEDSNHDGKQTIDEPALAGVTVTLLDKDGKPAKDINGSAVPSVTTDTAGKYLFSDLAEGQYQVVVTPPEGYVATKPVGDIDNTANDDSNCAADGKTALFSLTFGAEPTDDGDPDASSNLSVDCGFYKPTHSIGNRVWIDANNNGLADVGEEFAMAGIKLELKDATDKLVTSAMTDAKGRYLFSGLAAGSYQVCVIADNFIAGNVLEGYTASTGGNVLDANTDIDGDDNGTDDTATGLCSSLVVLDDKEPLLETTATGMDGADGVGTEDARSNLTIDFGIVPPVEPAKPVSVGDYIWIDTNKDGLQSEGEVGLAGATVTLLDKDGNPAKDVDGNAIAPSVTGADGLYGFTKLPEGDYSINVKAPEGYLPTQNAGSVDDVPANNDSNCAAQPDGSASTALFNLTAEQEPDATVDGDGTNGNMTVDCGFYLPEPGKGTISGTVKADTTGDTMGEDALAGVLIALLNKDGTPVLDKDGKPVTTLTDTSGVYLFTDVAPGDYLVVETAPAGYTSVSDQDSTSPEDDAVNTNTNDNSIPVSVVANETDDGNDFVARKAVSTKPVSVGDYIWIDTNKDGLQSEGEVGLAGATVTLLDKDGNPAKDVDGNAIAPSVSGADGLYGFTKLPEGDYSINVKAPEGYLPTQNAGSVDDVPANNDSNCAAQPDGSASTALFNLTAEQEPDATVDGDGTNGNMTVDCGFYLPEPGKGTISGTVKADTTGDTMGEDALAGVLIALLNKDGTPVLDKDGKPVTTLTDTSGVYLFTDVAPGDYLVVETAPAGYTSVSDQDSTSPEDDAVNTNTNDNSIPVSVVANETDDGNDFVARKAVSTKPVSVGDYIWIDTNKDGLQSEGEVGLAGATVTLLDKDGKPAKDVDGNAIAPSVTGTDGLYGFTKLPEGDYSINVKAPEGYLPTQNAGSVDDVPANNDSNCAAQPDGSASTALFNLTAEQEPDATVDDDGTNGNMTVDCGFYLPEPGKATISGTVKADTTGDTVGEDALEGVLIALLNKDGTSVLDKDGKPVTTLTNTSGVYLFTDVAPGDYLVRETAPSDYVSVSDQDSTSPEDDTVNTNTNDNSIPVSVVANETDDGNDFVARKPVSSTPVSVGNQIWIDSNANGKRDEGESLLSGAVVALTDATGRAVTDLDGKPVASHTTGSDGLYVFSNLPEGDYIMTVQPPEGFFSTLGGIDVDDDPSDTDSNCRVNPLNSTIETHPFTLTAGMEPDTDGDNANGNMTVDCGFYGSVALGNKIWLDENANGQQDNAEPGIAGITVSLTEEDGITPVTDINGNLVAAVTTDANGNYLFENLQPGNYRVTVKPGTGSGYSLTKGGADPDTDPSNTDSNCKVVAGSYQTPAVTLLPGSEPGVKVDGDNENSNSTVDCGLIRPVNLGSRLWIDLDGNGKQDGGEPGVSGATVTLLDKDGKPVTDIFGNVLTPQTTDADGKYFFGNLREGAYVVNVVPPAGYLPTIAAPDPNNNDATDSNGILNPNGSISSQPIDLKWGEEPEDGGATNTTVGFGLIANIHVPTLSQWGMMLMSMLLATAAFFRRRRED